MPIRGRPFSEAFIEFRLLNFQSSSSGHLLPRSGANRARAARVALPGMADNDAHFVALGVRDRKNDSRNLELVEFAAKLAREKHSNHEATERARTRTAELEQRERDHRWLAGSCSPRATKAGTRGTPMPLASCAPTHLCPRRHLCSKRPPPSPIPLRAKLQTEMASGVARNVRLVRWRGRTTRASRFGATCRSQRSRDFRGSRWTTPTQGNGSRRSLRLRGSKLWPHASCLMPNMARHRTLRRAMASTSAKMPRRLCLLGLTDYSY